eukprot:scaffold87700_cov26-Prasinocladus_malaysianus.AAC.1
MAILAHARLPTIQDHLTAVFHRSQDKVGGVCFVLPNCMATAAREAAELTPKPSRSDAGCPVSESMARPAAAAPAPST